MLVSVKMLYSVSAVAVKVNVKSCIVVIQQQPCHMLPPSREDLPTFTPAIVGNLVLNLSNPKGRKTELT